MGFKRVNAKLLLLTLLLSGSSIILGWGIATSRFHLSILCSALVIVLVALLFSTLTRTNRDILFFLKALKNDDTSFRNPVSQGGHLIDELNHYLNELNRNFRDIKVDHELREQYFTRILENLSSGLLVLAGTGHVNHINEQALALFDLPNLSHVKALREVDPKLFTLVQGMKPDTKSEFRLQHKESGVKKELGLQCTSIDLRGEDVRIITVQDLSVEMERKEIDDWIRLIRVMSHEIMNSLAPITSISNTLRELWNEEELEDSGPGPKVSQTIRGLDAIAEQSEGLTTFFESYRVLSRIPDPVKKEFTVCSLLDKLETLVVHVHENSGTSFSFQCSDTSLKINADEQMITQVMLNLVKNAVQALEGTPRPGIELNATRSNSGILLSVSDNGPGIPAEIADEIFLPFFTTRDKGTGVGLSYSRQVMKLNGGNIDFESKEGRTVFWLRFP